MDKLKSILNVLATSTLIVNIQFNLVQANETEISSSDLSDVKRYELKLKLWERRDTNPDDWVRFCKHNHLDINGNPLSQVTTKGRYDDLNFMPPHIREQYLLLKSYQEAGSDKHDDLISHIETIYVD